jgi:hypothetical protein
MNKEKMSPLPRRVRVEVKGCTFGPHTDVFGIALDVLLGKRRSLSYSWGRGGRRGRGDSNTVDLGTYGVGIPKDFHTKDPVTQARIIFDQVERAGANLLYTTSPGRSNLAFIPHHTESREMGDDCTRSYLEEW